jgi:hypothetical protein
MGRSIQADKKKSQKAEPRTSFRRVNMDKETETIK